MGPTRTTTRGQTLTRGVEDKAADILALARSLVHENDATLGRSTSTLRKTMRKTQTQRAATTSPTSKLRTTRWKSRTMQQLANGRRCVEIKIYGAFVLNQRVVLHAIDATPARWRGDAGSSPLD